MGLSLWFKEPGALGIVELGITRWTVMSLMTLMG